LSEEKKLTVFGVEQLPRKVYFACTFEGLALRKDEFLERAVQAWEAKGFKRVPPIEPFGLSLGLKDGLKFWDWNWRGKAYLYQLIGADMQLESERKGAKYFIALRAEPRDGDLRFGYSYGRNVAIKSTFFIHFMLELIALIAYVLVAGFFMMKFIIIRFGGIDNPWAWTVAILITFLVIGPPYLVFLAYYFITKPKRLLNEANRTFKEVAESMGARQVAPFEKTTFKLEN